MALFQVDKVKFIKDDSDGGFDSEEFSRSKFDPESSLETINVSDTYPRIQFKTSEYQEQVDENVFESSAHVKKNGCMKIKVAPESSAYVKRKESKKLKDVVKDHVLPFLPAKTLMRLKSVSKEWNQRITSPLLAHEQSYSFKEMSGFFCQSDYCHTYMALHPPAYGVPSPFIEFLPTRVTIRSSCNGLLLCQGEDVYYVCNPVSRDYKELPPPRYYHGSDPAIILAFEPSVHNIEAYYQVVCAVAMLESSIVCFEIYSSKTRSWRISSSYCTELDILGLESSGFYMNGIAYWETSSAKLLAFDLSSELYEILLLAPEISRGGTLTQVQKELCYVTVCNHSGNVFIINIYGGMIMSLKQSIFVYLKCEWSITAQECKVLPCVNSELVVFLVGDIVCSYNLKDQEVKVVGSAGNNTRKRYLPYVNNLAHVS